jgi:hypothetical protein
MRKGHRVSRGAGKRQGQIESGQENPPKSPFNKGGLNVYPFNKGGRNVYPLNKGGLNISLFEKGGRGILKLKVFHMKIIILDAILT